MSMQTPQMTQLGVLPRIMVTEICEEYSLQYSFVFKSKQQTDKQNLKKIKVFMKLD